MSRYDIAHLDVSPENVALGAFKPLLPIVVVCPTWEEGNEVYTVQQELASVDPQDGEALRTLVATSDSFNNVLTHTSLFYPVRFGAETGIYVGFPWSAVEKFVIGFIGAKWARATTFREAMLFMLEKRVDPPQLVLSKTPKKTGSPRSATPLAKSASLPPTVKSPSRSPSPIKQGARIFKMQASTPTPTPSPSKTVGKRSASPLKYVLVHDESDDDNKEDVELAEALCQSMELSQDVPPHVLYLRQLLRPLGQQDDSVHQLPIYLGPRADAYLRGRGASNEEMLAILRARVYSNDVKAFTYALGLELGETSTPVQPFPRLLYTPPPLSISLFSSTTTALASMVRTDNRLIRLARELRNPSNKRVRVPYHARKKRKAIKLTLSQKAAAKEKRQTEKAEVEAALNAAREALWAHAEGLAERFGAHNADYYFRAIMQQPRLKRKRGVSRWNAFLSAKLKEHNDDLIARLGEDATKERVSSDVVKKFSEEWNQMSEEEKEAATADLVADLQERRETNATAAHNVAIASFHDASATITRVEEEVMMVAVRSDTDSYNKPHVFYTDNRIPDFLQTVLGVSVQEFALRMEAYCIAGMPNSAEVLQNYEQRVQELKSTTGKLILLKLQETCTRGKVSRMIYATFEESITVKYGVVCERWPLPRFCSPSDISSPVELEILRNAWESGTTRFRSLSNEEWAQWLDAWAKARLPVAPPSSSTSPSTTTASAPSYPPPSASPSSVHTPATATSPPVTLPASNLSPPPPTSSPASQSLAPCDPAVHVLGNTLDTAQDGNPLITAQDGVVTVMQTTQPSVARTEGVDGDDGARPGKKARRAPRAPPTVEFINSTTVSDGSTFVVPKATRRPRSDKGVPRGPRKKTAATPGEAVSVSNGSNGAVQGRPKKSKSSDFGAMIMDLNVGPQPSSAPAPPASCKLDFCVLDIHASLRHVRHACAPLLHLSALLPRVLHLSALLPRVLDVHARH
ncbi:hypothetical protein ACG7TL_002519 [Trametes sanguinea]